MDCKLKVDVEFSDDYMQARTDMLAFKNSFQKLSPIEQKYLIDEAIKLQLFEEFLQSKS